MNSEVREQKYADINTPRKELYLIVICEKLIFHANTTEEN